MQMLRLTAVTDLDVHPALSRSTGIAFIVEEVNLTLLSATRTLVATVLTTKMQV